MLVVGDSVQEGLHRALATDYLRLGRVAGVHRGKVLSALHEGAPCAAADGAAACAPLRVVWARDEALRGEMVADDALVAALEARGLLRGGGDGRGGGGRRRSARRRRRSRGRATSRRACRSCW